MTMTIELARFTVDDDAVTQLLAERPPMIQALRERFPGCLVAYLTREDDGSWLDTVLWRSRTEAEDATAQVNSVAECVAWFWHIATSGGIRHVEVMNACLWATPSPRAMVASRSHSPCPIGRAGTGVSYPEVLDSAFGV